MILHGGLKVGKNIAKVVQKFKLFSIVWQLISKKTLILAFEALTTNCAANLVLTKIS